MAFLNVDHPVVRYGDGVMSGAGAIGECVDLNADDTFVKNVTKANRSFGILKEAVIAGDKPVVVCGAGTILTTDQYDNTTTPPAANDELMVGADGLLTQLATPGTDFPVAQCLSNVNGVLKAKMLV